MKLITELSEEIQLISEEKDGQKRHFIEGIFMQGGIKNRNGRIYPTEMLGEKVAKYNKDYVLKNRAFGELGHPQGPAINGDRICMRITELKQDGDNFYGKAQISSTPKGDIVRGLISDGGQLGVSSRGMGSVKVKNGINEVQNDFILAAVDVVTDPSAPNAFVKGIMEGVEWVYVNDTWVPEYIDETRKLIHKTPKAKLGEVQIKVFEEFMQKL